ncbi:hypothetical protein CICLE_v10023577mg [Citrus x clementina]|uniref:Uncharacterized protein n=1 Tax=Citrus clementina TaxID=85681 RepID=V4TDE3_CITCL|nr:hypothetical protein CICLE_v10023577mg [Citrus x clementina]
MKRSNQVHYSMGEATTKDEKRGLAAVEKLKNSGCDNVIFHLLDVTDPASVDSLVHFVSSQFGKLDILVNNAGIGGFNMEGDNFVGIVEGGLPDNWYKMLTQTYELAEKCIQTNYYGNKRMCEALIPLLQLSDSPRIVNASSSMGKLKNITNEWAKGVLSDWMSICPGYVKTDLNHNNGVLTVEEGAESLVWLVLLPKGGPSKCVFLIENDTSLSLYL